MIVNMSRAAINHSSPFSVPPSLDIHPPTLLLVIGVTVTQSQKENTGIPRCETAADTCPKNLKSWEELKIHKPAYHSSRPPTSTSSLLPKHSPTLDWTVFSSKTASLYLLAASPNCLCLTSALPCMWRLGTVCSFSSFSIIHDSLWYDMGSPTWKQRGAWGEHNRNKKHQRRRTMEAHVKGLDGTNGRSGWETCAYIQVLDFVLLLHYVSRGNSRFVFHYIYLRAFILTWKTLQGLDKPKVALSYVPGYSCSGWSYANLCWDLHNGHEYQGWSLNLSCKIIHSHKKVWRTTALRNRRRFALRANSTVYVVFSIRHFV